MARRSRKTNFEDEIVEEAEVVTHWSIARIIIALVLLVVIIGGGILGVKYFINNSKKVLGSQAVGEQPKIELPTENRIQRTIEKAKKDLSEIDPKNVVESQPQIQKIINDLQNINSSSNSARRLICESICQ